MAAVVGREHELEALRNLLTTVGEPGARFVLVEGEPGIGKTTLWRSAIELAEAAGHRVLSCQAAGAETQLAFTSLRDLVGDVLDDAADGLPEPQRRALAVALLREEPPDYPLDPAAIAVAFLGVLRLLAERTPVLVAVDDEQWLDAASATALHYALRRLRDEPIVAVLTRRPVDGEARATDPRAERLALEGLSIGALGRILRERLDRTFARPLLVRLHEVAAGNPFYALEIARALPADGPRRSLPMPPGLRQLVEERLSRLPRETVEALAIVAALGRSSTGVVSAALETDAAPLLGPAVAASVLEVGGDEIRFAHPLFAAVVYELSSLRHRSIHARLAEVVDDPEQRARHLALANVAPDANVAALVARGAERAFARGSPAAAAELAGEAVRLTPAAEDELVRQRTLAEVDYQFAAGNTERASAVLKGLLEDTGPGPTRAELLGRQGRLRHFERDIGGSVALLHAALAEADDSVRGEIEEGLAWGLLLARRDLPGAAGHARSAAALAESRGDDGALAEALAVQALIDFVLGRPWEAAMERARALERATLHLRVLRHPSFAHGYVLSCADDVNGARAAFEELRARAEDAGDESSVPSLLNHLTLVECLAGRWDVAAHYAEDCYARALESGQRPTQTSILGKSALLAARRGEPDEARAKALEAIGPGFDASRPQTAMERGGETAVWALGSLELQLGRADEAHRLLGPMTDALIAAGVREPGEVRFLADEIEALVLLGDLERATALLAHLRDWARRVDRPSALAAAARCAGLLAAARGDDANALEELEHAASHSARAPLPFERGRSLLALGAQQRRARQRRAARETLEAAADVADELGATLIAARARDELARIGGRTPSGDELTPSERRVAELVAAGKTNKEVARELVVTERTVESALTQIYRKLDIRSRTELARRLDVDA